MTVQNYTVLPRETTVNLVPQKHTQRVSRECRKRGWSYFPNVLLRVNPGGGKEINIETNTIWQDQKKKKLIIAKVSVACTALLREEK